MHGTKGWKPKGKRWEKSRKNEKIVAEETGSADENERDEKRRQVKHVLVEVGEL